MKTLLKRSEVISQIKRYFDDSKCSISLELESIITESKYSIYYFYLLKKNNVYYTFQIHLIYGWIEFKYEGPWMPEDKDLAISSYVTFIFSISRQLTKNYQILPF